MASPPPSPPLPKKPKMSTPSSSDPEPEPESTTTAAAAAAEPKKPRYKRRKVAIFLAYCGFGYQGMQKNPGARTIEGDLEEALFLAGAVPESDKSCPKRYDWARSARTDKGVSAAGQVVSGRFYVDPPGFIDRLNSHLSDQIRAFGFKRVTNSFNSKKFCDRRRYVYLLPVFSLDPNSHPDRESVMASVGSGNELAKCVECSERGRKVDGIMGRQSRFSKEEERSKLELGNGGLEEEVGIVNGTLALDESRVAKVEERDDLGASSLNSEGNVEEKAAMNTIGLEPCESRVSIEEEKIDSVTNCEEMVVERTKFMYGDKEKERFNGILKRYVGTHNFHNFTTRTKAEDPSARRYIISFSVDRVVSIEGIEFVRCEVLGQSFMLHQIRKMIGLAVAMMRNCCQESLMDTALRQDININVPTAPEVGLYLDECFFTSYNQKWKDSHEALSMDAYADQAEEFRLTHIFPHIASMEHKEGAVALWLHSLNHRNYPDFHFQESNGGCVNAKDAPVNNLAE